MAKTVPDSLTPRRFIRASTATKSSESATACGPQTQEGRGDCVHPGGYRYRDGEYVVDEQGTRRYEGGVASQILPADRVRPTAVGVGVTGLPIRHDYHCEQDHDG